MSALADRPAARVLDNDAMFKRIAALNALYANYDRRWREWAALPADVDAETWTRHYDGYTMAKRAYEQCRDTPYALATGGPRAAREES